MPSTQSLLKLFEAVAEKAQCGLEHADFGFLSEEINRSGSEIYITQRYLYDAFQKSRKASEINQKEVKLNIAYLNEIAKYLTFRDFISFEKSLIEPPHPILEGCSGFWYSYVRCNSGRDDILMSPVRIFREEQKTFFELRSPIRKFRGELKLKGACLSVFLETAPSKVLHLVFQIGFCTTPKVLRGIFSGISTGGNPICGREILVKTEHQSYETMQNQKIHLQKEVNNNSFLDPKIADYFADYDTNYLKISSGSTFDLDDLMI